MEHLISLFVRSIFVDNMIFAFYNHFHQLNDSCDYSNEKNKAQEAEVNAFNDCVGSQHLGLQ